MTERKTREPTGPDSEPSRPVLAAEILLHRDGPAECTIYPAEASDLERLSTWITAKEGSFVNLDETR